MLREVALPSVFLVGLIIFIRLAGLFQVQEWMALDTFSRFCQGDRQEAPVVIVGIDENDLRSVGSFPIPDRDIAAVLRILQAYRPSVIGLDFLKNSPVEPGHAALLQMLKDNPNIIGGEVVFSREPSMNVRPLSVLSPERVGFIDMVVDLDGKLRRAFLAKVIQPTEIKYSLPLRLAQWHLALQKMPYELSLQANQPIQFGMLKLPYFQANSGAYVGADAMGHQMILNFCSNRGRIRTLSMTNVLQQNFSPEWIRDRVVIFGMIAASVKDVFFTSALEMTLASPLSAPQQSQTQIIYGVEAHAYTTAQIINAALHNQPLIQTWADFWEYLWIVFWGGIGILLSVLLQSFWKSLISLLVASLGLISICYFALLLIGLWLPLIPAIAALLSAGLLTTFFDQGLRFEVEQRRQTIERTYEMVHNGPLQILAALLRDVSSNEFQNDSLERQLRRLNEELRSLFGHIYQEVSTNQASLYLRGDLVIDFNLPLSDLLYQIYNQTRAEELPGFKSIRTFIPPNFEVLKQANYSLTQKRGLCLFLQEALINVGKHAIAPTRLDVVCTVESGLYVLRIIDNGMERLDADEPQEGQGTRQARAIARDLRGQFRRRSNTPQGTICELLWPPKRPWLRSPRR